MKILHVSHRFSPCVGGIETHVKQLCENLAAKGHETKVVCLDKCPNSSKRLKPEEKLNGIRVSRIGFLDLGFYKVAPKVFGKLGNADVVHVHGLGYFSDKLAATKIFHGKKLVLSTHGAVFHTKKLGLLKKIYFFGWCRLAMKAFDRIIAVSKADYELFARIAPRKKIVLIENPVDIKVLGSLKRSPVKNSFLFVGRLSRNKGFEEMLKAFAMAKEKGLDFSLAIAGKEFDFSEKELQKRAQGLGIGKKVSILGPVSDERLRQLYTESEFFVSASSYEGFGISAVEAMAAGLIPILNDIAPFRRFVKSGKNGFIVNFENREKAADALVQAIALGSVKKNLLAGSAKASAKRFSWENCIARFENLYHGLLVQS